MRRIRNRRRRGFTLMEVLLVLVIIVAIASMAVPMIGRAMSGANVDTTRAQVAKIAAAVEHFNLTVKRYPQSLDDLYERPGDLTNPNRWKGPYLTQRLTNDPWDNPYQYTLFDASNSNSRSGNAFDVWSNGPDGQDGTDDDIGNWTDPNEVAQ